MAEENCINQSSWGLCVSWFLNRLVTDWLKFAPLLFLLDHLRNTHTRTSIPDRFEVDLFHTNLFRHRKYCPGIRPCKKAFRFFYSSNDMIFGFASQAQFYLWNHFGWSSIHSHACPSSRPASANHGDGSYRITGRFVFRDSGPFGKSAQQQLLHILKNCCHIWSRIERPLSVIWPKNNRSLGTRSKAVELRCCGKITRINVSQVRSMSRCVRRFIYKSEALSWLKKFIV